MCIVHSTTLKEQIFSCFPKMEVHTHRRDVIIVKNEYIGETLHKACENDNDDEAITLSSTASIVRRYMLKMKLTFNGSIDSD